MTIHCQSYNGSKLVGKLFIDISNIDRLGPGPVILMYIIQYQ